MRSKSSWRATRTSTSRAVSPSREGKPPSSTVSVLARPTGPAASSSATVVVVVPSVVVVVASCAVVVVCFVAVVGAAGPSQERRRQQHRHERAHSTALPSRDLRPPTPGRAAATPLSPAVSSASGVGGGQNRELEATGTWRDKLMALHRDCRRVLLDHPRVASLCVSRPTPVAGVARFYDRSSTRCPRGGFNGAEAFTSSRGSARSSPGWTPNSAKPVVVDRTREMLRETILSLDQDRSLLLTLDQNVGGSILPEVRNVRPSGGHGVRLYSLRFSARGCPFGERMSALAGMFPRSDVADGTIAARVGRSPCRSTRSTMTAWLTLGS